MTQQEHQDSHTNNGNGFTVERSLRDGTVVERTVKYIPRLTLSEREELIVAYIRGLMNIDEFRLRVKKSRTQAFRIIKAFKDSDAYFQLLDDEWDRMTFSKEFDHSIPAVTRYQAITQLKIKRMLAIQVSKSVEGYEAPVITYVVDSPKQTSNIEAEDCTVKEQT